MDVTWLSVDRDNNDENRQQELHLGLALDISLADDDATLPSNSEAIHLHIVADDVGLQFSFPDPGVPPGDDTAYC